MPKIAILVSADSNKKLIEEVEAFLKLPVLNQTQKDTLFYLLVRQDRLMLAQIPGPNPIEVDFLSPKWKFKVKTLSKSQPFFKAINIEKKDPLIIDATAGLGEDTFSFLVKKHRVIAIEKDPIIYMLLKNGFDRLSKNSKWTEFLKTNFQLIHADAIQFLKTTNIKPDIIYLDPMYVEQSEAKPKKEMLFLRELIGEEPIDSLFSVAMEKAQNRVIVKRSIKASYLSLEPTHSFTGRSTRYDMYSSKL